MTYDAPLQRFTPQQQAADKLLRVLAESEAASPMGDALSLLVQKELAGDEFGRVAAGQKPASFPLHLPGFVK